MKPRRLEEKRKGILASEEGWPGDSLCPTKAACPQVFQVSLIDFVLGRPESLKFCDAVFVDWFICLVYQNILILISSRHLTPLTVKQELANKGDSSLHL